MERFTAWLCLSIALTGPLGSQAKIAYAIALEMSEDGQDVLESGQDDRDEEYDGSDALAVSTDVSAGIDSPFTHLSAFDVVGPIVEWRPSSYSEIRLQPPEGWVYRPPPTLRERLSSLQTFLI